MFSAFNPSECTHLEQWQPIVQRPGEQSWTPVGAGIRTTTLGTSGFKSNALSIRPTTASNMCEYAPDVI